MNIKRKKLVVGNWKMFKNPTQACADFVEFKNAVVAKKLSIEVGIAAPSLFLTELARKTDNHVTLFAQNAHWAPEGAFTGEISVPMLKSSLVSGSLVAHSERRQMFAETNKTAGARMGALLSAGMRAVYCIGETLEEREKGLLREVITTQLQDAFAHSGLKNPSDYIGADPTSPLLCIAYEPVWAIGTGKAASAKEAQEAHAIVREVLASILGQIAANQIKILYGGSVKTSNAKEYMSCPDVDGALVGGASLVAKDFAELCAICNE